MAELSTAELQKRFATVHGKRMAYFEAGAGRPHRLPARQPD